MDIAVVINPRARSGAHAHAASRATDRLRALGHSVAMLSGGSADETRALVRAALGEGVDAIAVVGGDGTVSLAANEVAGTGVPLGLIPSGTGNDVAVHLGVPADAVAAADVIDAGVSRAIDLARVTRADGTVDRYVSVLASGFDAAINERANRMRWPRGNARYNLAILLEFALLSPQRYRVEVDDEVVTGPLVMATVGNTRRYGGGVPICPQAVDDDGLLDVVLVHPAGRAKLLRLLPTLYRAEHLGLAQVQTLRGRRVRLEVDGPESVAYADGDPIGALPLTIEAEPGALTVFVPRDVPAP